MDMKFIGIIVTVVIIFALIYFFVISPSDKSKKEGAICKTTGGIDGIIQGGSCVPPRAINPNTFNYLGYVNGQPVALPLSFQSTLVDIGQTAQAVPNFNSAHENDLTLFNILTSAGSNPTKIHYVTGFSSPCPQYIWYKNWFYSFRGTQTNDNGNKTCYYGINKSDLPNEIKVTIPNGQTQCKNFKLYISGVEYKFSERKFESPLLGSPQVSVCVYKKQ